MDTEINEKERIVTHLDNLLDSLEIYNNLITINTLEIVLKKVDDENIKKEYSKKLEFFVKKIIKEKKENDDENENILVFSEELKNRIKEFDSRLKNDGEKIDVVKDSLKSNVKNSHKKLVIDVLNVDVGKYFILVLLIFFVVYFFIRFY